jgi:hypothetical protein
LYVCGRFGGFLVVEGLFGFFIIYTHLILLERSGVVFVSEKEATQLHVE